MKSWRAAAAFWCVYIRMLRLYSFIGATVGAYAGLALGATVGFMTAFMVSMVGTGLGIYAARRVARYYGG